MRLAQNRATHSDLTCKTSNFCSFHLTLELLAFYPANIGCKSGRAKMAVFGYARVSTRDQDLSGQVAELEATGCAKVFREKASGAKSDRAELAKLIGRLVQGDVLVV